MLVSAGVLALCAIVVSLVVRHARSEDLAGLEQAGKEKGVSRGEAMQMLRSSRHLQIIALVIAMTSIGAGLIDQQLNMATEAAKGAQGTDAMTAVLANVQVYTSVIGFVIQVWLTSRIQRFLGIGFALMILPLGLGSTALLILRDRRSSGRRCSRACSTSPSATPWTRPRAKSSSCRCPPTSRRRPSRSWT